MGKHPDDLPLDDAPLRRTRPVDVRDQPWYQFVQELEDLIGSGDYHWAEDTLRGLQQSVEHRQLVTDGQRRAVDNIRAARGRAEGWRRRRYEGWHR